MVLQYVTETSVHVNVAVLQIVGPHNPQRGQEMHPAGKVGLLNRQQELHLRIPHLLHLDPAKDQDPAVQVVAPVVVHVLAEVEVLMAVEDVN